MRANQCSESQQLVWYLRFTMQHRNGTKLKWCVVIVGGAVATNYTSATPTICTAMLRLSNNLPHFLMENTFHCHTLFCHTSWCGTHSSATLFTGLPKLPQLPCTVLSLSSMCPLLIQYFVDIITQHFSNLQLSDCVCLSKPNPPAAAGEDLRDSHQHFDSPPTPSPSPPRNLF